MKRILSRARRPIRASRTSGYVYMDAPEYWSRCGYAYDAELRRAEEETAQDLMDLYDLDLIGYAVKSSDLRLLDSDPDTQDAVTAMVVRDANGKELLVQYSRGMLREVGTGRFI